MKTLLVLAVLVFVATAVVLPHQRNSLGCQMCELAVKKYDGSVDKDVNGIKKDFDTECKKLFHSIPFAPQECEHYVNTKLDPIIKELESGTAPKDVCTKLHECP
ncbi:Saposin B-type domain-containing protein [Caenorhabditis elegans]|uniref:Saposin B-type domain-containing protein n=1 Tax=Caenorhabditis elegans TaxID=6239 RepID=Q22338_CAEEL|nr:Saposin B-type domain-containing protein [Caenorhabditis elegans]CCD63521.1 Saposin B-type domain-containing protein [Caenorhabditis elegans]|eukprot:NP_509237.1 SaPosin-like Protein family [Caenorhabditis elegans]